MARTSDIAARSKSDATSGSGPWRFELAIDKCRVQDQLRLGIGYLSLAPRLDLALHRLEVPLDAAHPDGECIDEIEPLRVYSKQRCEIARDNVSKFQRIGISLAARRALLTELVDLLGPLRQFAPRPRAL